MKTISLILVLFSLMPIPILSADDTLSVQVKETKLRSAPKQWATSVSSLKYGDTIVPIKAESDWVEGIASSNKKGFVHVSALSSKKIVLSSGKVPNIGIESSDVILAGKGFSKATEDEYAKQNSSANFAAVNSVETLILSDSELSSFMKDGQIGMAYVAVGGVK